MLQSVFVHRHWILRHAFITNIYTDIRICFETELPSTRHWHRWAFSRASKNIWFTYDLIYWLPQGSIAHTLPCKQPTRDGGRFESVNKQLVEALSHNIIRLQHDCSEQKHFRPHSPDPEQENNTRTFQMRTKLPSDSMSQVGNTITANSLCDQSSIFQALVSLSTHWHESKFINLDE